jgi:CubicO group peptidase (beta-lactamase class C family)
MSGRIFVLQIAVSEMRRGRPGSGAAVSASSHSNFIPRSAMLASDLMSRFVRISRRSLVPAIAGVLSFFLFVSRAAAQSDPRGMQGRSPALRQAMADAAKKYKIPGMAVAWIERGRAPEVEVFGVRDVNSNAPITPNTIFEAGPLGEPLYAYAVLLLANEGRFNPAAPLPTISSLPYVRDLDLLSASPATEPLSDPRFNQITASRVMSHTSGMPDWARNQPLQLQLPPGQKWLYSSEGYLYLQTVVEHVTGESTEQFISRRTLAPAGMPRSSFVWRETYAGEIATGYDRSGAPVEAHHYTRPAATATFYTTVREYAQFVTFLIASAPAQRAHEAAVTQMLGPAVSADDTPPFSWGLGIGLEKSGEDTYFFHRENGAAFQAFAIASRQTGSGVVIFTNSGSGLDAVPDILAATIGGNHPVVKSSFLRSH